MLQHVNVIVSLKSKRTKLILLDAWSKNLRTLALSVRVYSRMELRCVAACISIVKHGLVAGG
jgi:hypothetical protein